MEKKKRKPVSKKERDEDDDQDDHGDSEGEDDPDAMHYKLDSFDIEKLPLDCFVILVGKRRRGKTVYLEYILSKRWQYYPRGAFVFTRTRNNHYWEKHVPKNCIYPEFDEYKLAELFEEQREIQEGFYETGNIDVCPYRIIILDDIISDSHINYEEMLAKLAFEGRHYQFAVFITTQDVKGLGPKLRGNADAIALSFTSSKRVIDSISEDYATLFKDGKKDMKALIRDHTQSHGFLLIDQAEAHYDVEETFYKDRAPDPKSGEVPDYKIGDDAFWDEYKGNWEEQLQKYKNLPLDWTNEQWLKLAMNQAQEAEENPRFRFKPLISNTVDFADQTTKNALKKAAARKRNAPTMQDTVDRIRGAVRFKAGSKSFFKNYVNNGYV